MAALPWLLNRRTRAQWRTVVTASALGYATHGVLDASTTYGTLLLWPFSDVRIAWNWISIIDPAFTSILIVGLLMMRRASCGPTFQKAGQHRPGHRRPAVLALVAVLAYLAAGAWQRDRALAAQHRLAASRGHVPARAEVFPGFATNIIWRSLYEVDDTLVMDRIRVPWVGPPGWSPGTTVPRLEESSPGPAADVRLRRDLRRFDWFSSGWIARGARDPDLIGDARYSLSTTRFDPVWGIRLHPGREPPVEWVDRSATRRVNVIDLWREIIGSDTSYRAIP